MASCVMTFPNDVKARLSLTFSPDGQFLLAGLTDGTLKTYTADGTQNPLDQSPRRPRIYKLAFRRDGRAFAAVSTDRTPVFGRQRRDGDYVHHLRNGLIAAAWPSARTAIA